MTDAMIERATAGLMAAMHQLVAVDGRGVSHTSRHLAKAALDAALPEVDTVTTLPFGAVVLGKGGVTVRVRENPRPLIQELGPWRLIWTPEAATPTPEQEPLTTPQPLKDHP